MSKKTKMVLYWVVVAFLVTVILVCVGLIAHKLISDAQDKAFNENLANDKNALTTGTRPTGTAPTVPTKPNESTTPTAPSILPEYAPSYALNNDMVGWIQIPGTSIDYPVVQSLYEPNYYLRRNFQKQNATCGTIYVREACDVNKPSDSVLLYGHNMRNGTMFHDLINFKEKSFWEANRYIYFDTLTEYHTYEIVAVFTTTADPSVGFRYHIFSDGTQEVYDKFVANCKALSLFDTGITPQYGEKLLTLSTCDKTLGYGDDGRLVVVARRII